MSYRRLSPRLLTLREWSFKVHYGILIGDLARSIRGNLMKIGSYLEELVPAS
jgi:hypothetical protein